MENNKTAPEIISFLSETKSKIIKTPEILQERYIPPGPPIHRSKEITEMAEYIAQIFRSNIPRHCFIYGKMGTGKTIVTKYIIQEILKKAKDQSKNIHTHMINCKLNRTINSILANIINNLSTTSVGTRGYTIDERIDQLAAVLNKISGHFIFVLDEVDNIADAQKDQTDIFYILTRMATTGEKILPDVTISVISISNDLKFYDTLDGRIKSTFGQTEFIFPPYNAAQLQDILKQRATQAFHENMLDPSVLPLCAAIIAQESGDARRVIELLRNAAEVAERRNKEKITEDDVRGAQAKMEIDRVTATIETLPVQHKIVLYGIAMNSENGYDRLTTGENYDTYKNVCKKTGLDAITLRRFSDIVSELDTINIISARLVSYGRGGKTREITLAFPIGEVKETLMQDATLNVLRHYKLPRGSGFF